MAWTENFNFVVVISLGAFKRDVKIIDSIVHGRSRSRRSIHVNEYSPASDRSTRTS